MDAIKTTYNDQ